MLDLDQIYKPRLVTDLEIGARFQGTTRPRDSGCAVRGGLSMTNARDDSNNPSRRAVVGAGGALLGANFLSSPAKAALAQLSLPDKAPQTPPTGYNILFVLVDQEHFFEKWPFPVPGREYLKANGTSFLNHQGASQVCSSARSVIFTGQHIQHTGVFDNMEAPWQRDMSTDKVTIGERLRKLGYHAAYQGKWHLSGHLDTAHKPVDAPLLQYRDAIAKLMSLYIVLTTASKAAVCALAHKSKCRFERVATHRSGGHKADVNSQPTNAARRWASTSTAV